MFPSVELGLSLSLNLEFASTWIAANCKSGPYAETL
jgi:hypothetical protein